MRLGKVVGTVVASQKQQKLAGAKLMLLCETDPRGEPVGAPFVAVDTVSAGPGEVVLYTSGSAARYGSAISDTPIDHVIVGIVDCVEFGGAVTYDKATAG